MNSLRHAFQNNLSRNDPPAGRAYDAQFIPCPGHTTDAYVPKLHALLLHHYTDPELFNRLSRSPVGAMIAREVAEIEILREKTHRAIETLERVTTDLRWEEAGYDQIGQRLTHRLIHMGLDTPITEFLHNKYPYGEQELDAYGTRAYPIPVEQWFENRHRLPTKEKYAHSNAYTVSFPKSSFPS
ncbi:hypothetical protein NEOLEDRAFT_1184073 [Neolentinus lepideus HHB14362 ss-1]|uniref:Uncharacterized protein n=1 Tax=Neolentinus lepideus HHB14362 ss-1 TaxID=1314782 RepID=A0A165MRK5_9AGAM|nr:hypothetical protein NEOLEDRAFT_1184073 [Neolentinus lepideus HHB14362 ss-1]